MHSAVSAMLVGAAVGLASLPSYAVVGKSQTSRAEAAGELAMATEQDVLAAELKVLGHSPDGGIEIQFEVNNLTERTISVQFNSGMGADLQLLDNSGNVRWAWSQERMFTQALRQQTLGVSERIDYRFSVPAEALASCGQRCQVRAMFDGRGADGAMLLSPRQLELAR